MASDPAHRDHRSRGRGRHPAPPPAGPQGPDTAAARRGAGTGRGRGRGRGVRPGVGHGPAGDARGPHRGRRGHPPRRPERRGAVGPHPRHQHQRHPHGPRSGPPGRRAPRDHREQQPRGGLPPPGRGRGTGLPLPPPRHLLRREQGGRRGPGQPLPRPLRPGRGLRPHRRLLRNPHRHPPVGHLAVPGRLRAPDGGAHRGALARLPRGVGRLGQHPPLVLAGRGTRPGLRTPGRRRALRRRTRGPARPAGRDLPGRSLLLAGTRRRPGRLTPRTPRPATPRFPRIPPYDPEVRPIR
ncbi:hypothetical protein SGPA1_40544 [Streptomyces misionensis JCM 4497]